MRKKTRRKKKRGIGGKRGRGGSKGGRVGRIGGGGGEEKEKEEKTSISLSIHVTFIKQTIMKCIPCILPDTRPTIFFPQYPSYDPAVEQMSSIVGTWRTGNSLAGGLYGFPSQDVSSLYQPPLSLSSRLYHCLHAYEQQRRYYMAVHHSDIRGYATGGRSTVQLSVPSL
jgi:hypothetical protein